MTKNRVLLPPAALAKKLGYASLGRDLMDRLYRAGFPQPVLGAGAANAKTNRWDEYAVDLWLDSRMPQDLQKAAKRIDPRPLDATAMQDRLAQRAQEIRI